MKMLQAGKGPMITEISAPTLIHSSSSLPGILKESQAQLSVLPHHYNEYSGPPNPDTRCAAQSVFSISDTV